MRDPEKRIVTVFTKEPAPGRVKTRLTPPFSPDQAARLATAMLLDTVEKLRSKPDWEVRVAVAPVAAAERVQVMFPKLRVHPQRGEHLGERLARHFEMGFAHGPHDLHVVVGSDAPHVPVAWIEEAFDALASGDRLVLGPDTGGGYYLAGLQGGAVSTLFTEIGMSTSYMFERTMDLARGLGLSVHLLPRGYDLDLPVDVERLRRDLAQHDPASFHFPKRTAALLETTP